MKLLVLISFGLWCGTSFAAPFATKNSVLLNVNDVAPAFSLPLLDSTQEISLANYKGKVVYLDFWASWCIPCRRSFPFLNKLRAQYADKGFEIIAINLDQNPASTEAFLAKYPVSYPIAKGASDDVANSYNVTAMPTAYLIGKDGTIRSKHLGFKPSHQDYLEAVVDKLVSEFE